MALQNHILGRIADWTAPDWTVTICSLAIIAAVLLYLFQMRFDPREPPVVHPRFPWIGHVVGMLIHGPLYLKTIR